MRTIKGTSLDDILVFAEVAQANGFRAAADRLNLGAGSVSGIVKRLESRLGVRLIERTTRKMSLTSAGEKLLESALPALADLDSALGDLGEQQNTVSGTLRLSAPHSSSSFFLNDLIAKFMNAFPQVCVEVLYDDSKVDLVTSGIDAAIRSQTLLEKETYAIEIGPQLEMALVASPDYLSRMGTPGKPDELVNHNGICFAFGRADRLAPWSFAEGKSKSFTIAPMQRMIVNDLESAINFAKAGLGLAYVYKKPADIYIQSGELVTLFDKFIPQLPRYTINYLTKRHMPARLRAFIELAKQND